jgi:hypothetical protein
VSLGIKMGDLRCYPFLNPHKKKNTKKSKNCKKKTKKYINENRTQGCLENDQRLVEEVQKYKD